MVSGKQFDTSRPCAACGKPGHTFDDCPVLNDVDFPRKHHIGFQLFLGKQNTVENGAAQVNAMQVDSPDVESPDGSINDASEEDFHQGQEWRLAPNSIPAAQLSLNLSIRQHPPHRLLRCLASHHRLK